MDDTNKKLESNFWSKTKNFFSPLTRFVKKHPAAAAGILGLFIGGAIATGGILLLPAAVGLISTAGMWIGMAATATAVAALTHWAGCCGGKASTARSVVSILAACASVVGPVALVTVFPIAGVVMAGIAAATAIAGLFALCGRWVNHCFRNTPLASPLDLHPRFVAVGNSYKYLPPGLSPKAGLKTQLDATAGNTQDSAVVVNKSHLPNLSTQPTPTQNAADMQQLRQRKVS